MAIVQVGYLVGFGPTFVDDANTAAGAGKYVVLQGNASTGRLQAVQPAFAAELTGFPYTAAQCSLGQYSDLQDAGAIPAHVKPPASVTGYANKGNATDWIAVGASTSTAPSTTTGGTTTGSGTTTTGTTSTGGTTTTTGTGTTTVFSAPDTTTTVESFLSKYWWAILLVAVVLLWKPVIAPALGIRSSRRRYSR